jgi:hypothetical protein
VLLGVVAAEPELHAASPPAANPAANNIEILWIRGLFMSAPPSFSNLILTG